MKLHPIFSFLIGMISSSLIVIVVVLGFLLFTFNLAGGETLSDIENKNITHLALSVLLLIIAFACAKRYRKKSTGFGILVLPVFVFLATATSLVTDNLVHTKFDQTAWLQSEWKPENMAKSLVRDKALIGLTRNQVKERLGEGAAEYGYAGIDRGLISYQVMGGWTMNVLFHGDKAIEVDMRQRFLDM